MSLIKTSDKPMIVKIIGTLTEYSDFCKLFVSRNSTINIEIINCAEIRTVMFGWLRYEIKKKKEIKKYLRDKKE